MLTVRPARLDDADEIVRINVAGWRKAYAGIVPEDVLAAMAVGDRAGQYQDRMRQPGPFENLVVVDRDQIVGYVALGPYRVGQRDGLHSRRVGEVIAIYVDPPRWGTGAGRALIEAALHRLAERGFETVRLWVLADNTQARWFYERAGFTPDGTHASYPVSRPDGTVVDLPELRYTRRLP